MSSRHTSQTLAVAAVVGVLFCAAQLRAQNAPVKVWQDAIRLVTYAEGDPQSSPQFSIYTPETPNYPYPVRSVITQDRRTETWRTVNLENEFLVCQILPDFGGHLRSCVDKRDQREMFYANPVIRKGIVGLRGAWAPIGIESNFPATHSRDSASPVDFAWTTDADGAGHVVLEDLDRVTGMQWRVDYILRPGQAELEQRVTFHNRGAARQPYLWWANAGIGLDDPAMRFIVPTNLVMEHGGTRIEKWPVTSAGSDESRVAGHTENVAWFAYDSKEPFMAVYKPGSRSGVAHYADASAVAGKKIWMWGSKQDEAYVRRELTENFNSYVELQAGVFQDQETWEFLQPQQTRTFTEYWIPIRDLGGLSRVTPDAIANMERRTPASGPAQLLVELEVTHALQGAVLRLSSGGTVVWETRAALTPATPLAHAIDNPSSEPFSLQLTDSRGKILLEHTENKYDARGEAGVKLGPQPQTNWSAPLATEAFAVARAEHNELAQHWAFALGDYAEGMKLFPNSAALRKGAGRLAVELRRNDEAVNLLTRVHAESPADAETTYLLGVAQAGRGHWPEARKMLAEVEAGSAFARPAMLQLARLAARQNENNVALAILGRLLSSGGVTVQAGGIEVALLRRSGKIAQARGRLAYWSAIDPADNFLRFERTRLETDDPELWTHLAADAERVIEIADEYINLGFYQDALAALDRKYPTAASQVSQTPGRAEDFPATQQEPGAVAPADSPLVAYYRAYCRVQLGRDGSGDRRLAASQSPRYAFPYRTTSLEVLRSAARANPSDAMAHLLMGRYYMSALLDKEATAEWELARNVKPAIPELYRDLSRALLEIKKDGAGAVAVAREGLTIDPANGELKSEFDAASKLPQRAPVREARVLSPEQAVPIPRPPVRSAPPPVTPLPPAPVVVQGSLLVPTAIAAMRQAAAGRAEEAARIFDPKLFNASKEPDDIRRAYIEVQLQRLLARARRSENCPAVLDALAKLGAQEPSLPFTFYGFGPFMRAAHFQFYMGVVEASCGNERDARKRWAKIAKQSEGLPSPEFVFPLLANAKVDDAGKATLAVVLTAVQAASPPESSMAKAPYDYAEGMLLDALGKAPDAEDRLTKARGAAVDSLLQYLTDLALQEIAARTSPR